jgi:hypothetical protein
MINLLSIQLLLPLALSVWLFKWPQTSRLGTLLQSSASVCAALASYFAGIWTSFPRWGLVVVALAGLAAIVLRSRKPNTTPLPDCGRDWLFSAFHFILLGAAIWVLAEVQFGHRKPSGPSIALEMPLKGKGLVVGNGGSRLLINAHQDTLDLTLPRHRLWRGQSYAVDIVALTPFQMTSNFFHPVDPDRYVIFGRPVHAPCSGIILDSENTQPDLPVPEFDEHVMEGNYIRLRCDGAEVVMAHLKRGSVSAVRNQRVTAGDVVAAVGNSGMSGEPHLHIHAQTPGSVQAPFSGEPIAMLFNGRFLARNDRI